MLILTYVLFYICFKKEACCIKILFIFSNGDFDQPKLHLRNLCSTLSNYTYSSRSYSYNYGVAVLSDFPISIDIEKRRSLNENRLNRLIHFSCNDNDQVLLKSGVSFLQIWTIKEAYAKFLRKGLFLDFKQISLEKVKNNHYIVRHFGLEDLHVSTLSGSTCFLAIAYQIGSDYYDKND
ncbi:phosphopantetheinyl transferase [Natronobacillus azotifigens]|uniref:4'-phosphopantetheinyl transferase superfamily protein n=1 Tax=Natronobacillus azotifigens TaxID=472978 RepID=UPI003AF0D85F